MKQILQLRIGQQLTMTPQLQQAIRLLQLSTLELSAEIQENLESNPLLELDEGGQESAGEAETTESSSAQAEATASEAGEGLSTETPADQAMETETTVDDMPVDTSWEDVYDSGPVASAGPAPDSDGRDLDAQNSADTSLREHLIWQMQLSPFSDRDLSIALSIIDAIDERGYFTATIEDIRAELAIDDDVLAEEVEAVLHRIQQFDPRGVAARDLQECLSLQLQALPPETPRLAEARTLVDKHIDLLGSRDYARIMRQMAIDEQTLCEAVGLIQTLNPAPGESIATARTEYVVPDVFVRRHEGRWRVELNSEAIPRLRINRSYAAMARDVRGSQDADYIRSQLQEARWFVKSLQSRNETLLRVAQCIVQYQRGFLEHGEEAMRPMILQDIAQEIGMHESTISRVTTRKYMHTPRGVFELKYFFSSHVGTTAGGECSATAIRAVIRRLIEAEDPRRPLSDSKLAGLLQEQGIQVARRTVAKYREAMSIPTSSQRRRLV